MREFMNKNMKLTTKLKNTKLKSAKLNNGKAGNKLLLRIGAIVALSAFSFSSALAVVNPANLAQAGYWYIDDDIRVVLKSRLDAGSTYVAPALPFESQVLLKDIIRDSVNEAKNVGTALVPVNFSNSHWAALAIKKTGTGAIKVIYNDSFGSPIGAKANSTLLAQVLRQIDPNIEIVDLQVVQQTDGSSCGAFTAENLIKIAELDVSNLSPEQLRTILGKINDASAIRNSHFFILYEGDGVFDVEILRPKAEAIANELQSQNRQLIRNLSNINTLTHDRLAGLTRTNVFAGVASGENTQDHGVWLKGFVGSEKDKGSVGSGVLKNSTSSKSNLHGFILGADTKLDEDTTVGIAFSHGQSKTRQKLQGILTNTDKISSNIFSLYGSSDIDEDISLNANIAYGSAVIKTRNNNAAGSSSKQKGNLFGGSLVANYNLYSTEYIAITPKIGTLYTHLKLKGHEDGAMKINKIKQQELQLNIGIVISSFHDTDSFTLIPEVSADYSYGVWRKGNSVKITNQLDQTIIAQKISNNKGAFKLGGGLTIAGDVLELGGGYEHSIQGKSRGHTGYVKLRVNF